jgi:hypothetical protein
VWRICAKHRAILPQEMVMEKVQGQQMARDLQKLTTQLVAVGISKEKLLAADYPKTEGLVLPVFVEWSAYISMQAFVDFCLIWRNVIYLLML